MNFTIPPLNSREYKIILKPDAFKDNKKGRDKLIHMIESQSRKQRGMFETAIEENTRKTCYLDTKKEDLYDKNKFLLRVREEHKKENDGIKGYSVTLKNRHPDRLIAASYDVSSHMDKPNPNLDFKKKEKKFEEDITTPFISKFSTSVNLDYEKPPELNKFQDLLSIFPNLKLDVPSNENLLIVNGFVAKEISCTLGKLKFNDGSEVRLQYSLWHLSKKKTPVMVEFDIDVEAKEPSKSSETLFEGFPLFLLTQVYEFYQALQKKGIADFKAPKTKTQFAYEYKK